MPTYRPLYLQIALCAFMSLSMPTYRFYAYVLPSIPTYRSLFISKLGLTFKLALYTSTTLLPTTIKLLICSNSLLLFLRQDGILALLSKGTTLQMQMLGGPLPLHNRRTLSQRRWTLTQTSTDYRRRP